MLLQSKILSAIVVTLVVCHASAEPAANQPGDWVMVCEDAGAGGYEAFPDICRLKDGRLMVAFYAGDRHITESDAKLPKGGRLCAVYSSDNGKTWSKAETIYDGPYDDRDSGLTQMPDGSLICTFFCWPHKGTFTITSNDGGKTWSDPTRVAILYNVSSPARVLSTGRIIVPLYAENPANGVAQGAAALSDDGGKSWTHISHMDNANKYLDAETDIIELRDGILYAIHRGGEGVPMHFTTSMDKGTNWGRTKPLDFIGHCPYLLRASEQIIVMGYRGLEGDQWRTLMRYSVDECRTWSEPILIDKVRGAYPSMAVLADGSILVVYYEEGAGSNIRARRFKIERLGVTWLPIGDSQAAALDVKPR